MAVATSNRKTRSGKSRVPSAEGGTQPDGLPIVGRTPFTICDASRGKTPVTMARGLELAPRGRPGPVLPSGRPQQHGEPTDSLDRPNSKHAGRAIDTTGDQGHFRRALTGPVVEDHSFDSRKNGIRWLAGRDD